MRCRRPLLPPSVIAVAALSLLRPAVAAARPRPRRDDGPERNARLRPLHALPRGAELPRPHRSGEIPKDKIVPLVGTPQFQAAQSACQHVMPAGGLGPHEPAVPQRTRLADALAFARCMRARGFTSFPDPTNQGQLTPQMVTAAGIDLHQPDLLRAGLACVPVTTACSPERRSSGP